MVNLRGVNSGRLVQNVFTTTKIASLIFIATLGCLIAPNHHAIKANFGNSIAFLGTRTLSPGLVAAFGAAMVGGLFSADAWASVTFAASEVRNPQRDLPRALAFGTGIVIALYILTNLSYLFELPAIGVSGVTGIGVSHVFSREISGAQSDRVAAAAMQVVMGEMGAVITAILVMVSTFGCANGLILTGARVVYAMANDGVFINAARRLNTRSVPAVALLIQGVWASLLTVSGTYSELLDYVIFAQLLFYVLTVAAVFILRIRRPDTPRPYRAWGHPWVPAAYIRAAIALMADLLVVRPRYTWPGLLIALSALPVYWLTSRRRNALAADSRNALP